MPEEELNSSQEALKRGFEYFEIKDYENGMKEFDEAVRLNPNDANYYNIRGWLCFYLMQFDQALKDFTEIIILNQMITIHT
jgi:tetratricopeptide (TPR) repeat protein